MEKPDTIQDYQLQNLILNALAQGNSNIASESGNLLFGNNGVLINEPEYNVADSDYYVIAAKHNSDIGSPENISIIKTTDLTYDFDNSLFGWKSDRHRFISQRHKTVSALTNTSMTFSKVFSNRKKNCYLMERSGIFNSPAGSFYGSNVGSEYRLNSLRESISNSDSIIVDGNTTKKYLREGIYKLSYFFNTNVAYSVSQRNPLDVGHHIYGYQKTDFKLQIGSKTIVISNIPEWKTIETSGDTIYYIPLSINNIHDNYIIPIDRATPINFNFIWYGALFPSQSLSNYATYNFKLYLEEV